VLLRLLATVSSAVVPPTLLMSWFLQRSIGNDRRLAKYFECCDALIGPAPSQYPLAVVGLFELATATPRSIGDRQVALLVHRL
jgi:hypothetical protein